jgi:hypothetical protein
MWLGQGTQGMHRDFGEEVLENVSLEEGVEDRMMTLEKLLVRQLCEDGRLTELTVDGKRRWVLTLAALNSRVSLAESWGSSCTGLGLGRSLLSRAHN